jgi:uncharacterized protein involved in outer membrane biogenesis
MKVIRIILTLIGALIAVAITLVALLIFNPSWQRALVEQVLASDLAREWQLGQIHISPGRVELADVYVLGNEFGVEMKRLNVEGALWAGLWKRSIEIRSASVDGLYLDLTNISISRASEDWESFVKRLQEDPELWKDRLGVFLSQVDARGWHIGIDQMEVTGGVLLPGGRFVPVELILSNADSSDIGAVELELMSGSGGDRI